MEGNQVTIQLEPEKLTAGLCKFHSLEVHNYWIGRGYKCPYCLIGSKYVPKCMIDEGVFG